GAAYQDWIMDQAERVWTVFDAEFRRLWTERGGGDAFVAPLFSDPDGQSALKCAQDRHMEQLFADTLGFAGCKMIRRVLGLAHVEDLERIADPDRRAVYERKVLRLGRELVRNRRRIAAFADVRARTLHWNAAS